MKGICSTSTPTLTLPHQGGGDYLFVSPQKFPPPLRGRIKEGEKIRIGIDVSRTLGERTGVGNYIVNLVEALAEIDANNEYLFYPYFWECFPSEYQEVVIPHRPNFRLHQNARPLGRIFKEWQSGDPDLLVGPVDVVHSPNITAPPLRRARLVVTIHDLSYILYPECHTKENLRFSLQQTAAAVRNAARIIAVSESTKQDLLRFYPIVEERIAVIYEAPRPVYRPERDAEVIHRCLAKFALYGNGWPFYGNFLLFVGALEPRKNLTTLLQAYAEVVKISPRPYLLVVAGGKGWLNDEVYTLVGRLGLSEKVRFLGYVEEEDLRILYSTTRLFVYPSLCEGFGLPVVEAMACGAPVITSTASSLPEVAGDAAILIDPQDVGGLVRAIQAVLTNDELRQNLRKKSPMRAKQFTWTETARKTLEVYRQAMASSLPRGF